MNSPSQTAPASSNYRWVICALLFFATTFNYLDRQVISYLKEFFCRSQDAGRVWLVQHRLRLFDLLLHGNLRLHDTRCGLGH